MIAVCPNCDDEAPVVDEADETNKHRQRIQMKEQQFEAIRPMSVTNEDVEIRRLIEERRNTANRRAIQHLKDMDE